MAVRIKKIGDNKHLVTVEAGRDPLTGTRKRIVRTVNGSQRDAESVGADLLGQVEKGTYRKPNKTPMGTFLSDWLATHEGNIAPSTHDGYRRIIKKHLAPGIGHIALSELQTITIQNYYTKKLKEGLSKRTVEQHHAVLNRALNHARQWGIISRNPAEDADPPRPERPPVKYVEAGRIDTFLESIKGHRDEHLIVLALNTGMRQGELLALTWANVDIDNGKIKVVRTVGHIKGEFIFRDTAKSKRSRRVVLLDDDGKTALRKQKAMVNQERLKSKNYSKDCDLVFPEADGTPLDPSDLGRRFKRLSRRAGFDLTFHGLRHTHATYLLEIGVPARIVQDRLGIETIGVLMDTYTHVSDVMQLDVIKRLNESKAKNKNPAQNE